MTVLRAITVLCIVAASTLRASSAQDASAADKNTGKFSWPDRARIEFRPTPDQKKSIDAAMRDGKTGTVVQLTPEQAAWVTKNYGASVHETTVRWLKTPPAVVISPALRYEFREFYSMECSQQAGVTQCSTERVPLQVEVRPTGTVPSASVLSTLKVAPVFTPAQRTALEQTRRAGKPTAMFWLTAAERKMLAVFGHRTVPNRMSLAFMAAPEPARIIKQRQLAGHGCTMVWQSWCDNYGCHMLCYPQCD